MRPPAAYPALALAAPAGEHSVVAGAGCSRPGLCGCAVCSLSSDTLCRVFEYRARLTLRPSTTLAVLGPAPSQHSSRCPTAVGPACPGTSPRTIGVLGLVLGLNPVLGPGSLVLGPARHVANDSVMYTISIFVK